MVLRREVATIHTIDAMRITTEAVNWTIILLHLQGVMIRMTHTVGTIILLLLQVHMEVAITRHPLVMDILLRHLVMDIHLHTVTHHHRDTHHILPMGRHRDIRHMGILLHMVLLRGIGTTATEETLLLLLAEEVGREDLAREGRKATEVETTIGRVGAIKTAGPSANGVLPQMVKMPKIS